MQLMPVLQFAFVYSSVFISASSKAWTNPLLFPVPHIHVHCHMGHARHRPMIKRMLIHINNVMRHPNTR
jgi:hypothetical protein